MQRGIQTLIRSPHMIKGSAAVLRRGLKLAGESQWRADPEPSVDRAGVIAKRQPS